MAMRSKRALERAIEKDKEQLQEALTRLGSCVKEEVDPRVRVANSPYVALGVSFAVGFVVAILGTTASRANRQLFY